MPPKIDMSREEAAEREIGVTRFSPGVKILLVAVFLGSIAAIPFIQSTRGFGASWNAEIKSESVGVLGRLSSVSHFLKTGFQGIESSLEKNSFLTKAMLPAMQTIAFRYFGLGNEKVYVARDGWLYYRPDVDYVLEGGITPNPRMAKAVRALTQLDAELKSRGIRLLLLPVPVKPVVESAPLSSNAIADPLHNASYQEFLADLSANGIEVFDPTSLLNTGDLAVMLQLLPEAGAALAETAEIDPVTNSDPDPASEVLLLGDSFTNIYSTPDLGWGEGAGLAEQLSWNLGKPIDRISINAGGALSVRQALARNPARLDGKKTVVYQFAVRELTSGDWRSVSIPATVAQSPSTEGSAVLEGVVKAVSRLPEPGSVPYKDALISLHLGDINGDPQSEALVFLKGMTANEPTEATALNPGDRISLGVVPWESVENKVGSITRIELDGEAAELETVYWSEKVPVIIKP